MELINCKGNGIYLVKYANGFWVQLKVDPDIQSMINIDELRFKINNILLRYGICARTYTFWHNNEIHFKQLNDVPWTKFEAKLICRIIQDQNTRMSNKLRLKKRVRQVRDALNKCKDVKTIEQIANKCFFSRFFLRVKTKNE